MNPIKPAHTVGLLFILGVGASPALAQLGPITRVSVDSVGTEVNADSGWPSISADGRFVCFESLASNLVPNDTNGSEDIFVHDRLLGSTERVSVSSTGAEGRLGYGVLSGRSSAISGDGRFVAFATGLADLVPGDPTAGWDVFIRDRLLGTTSCASLNSNNSPSNFASLLPVISVNGRFVAFHSRYSFVPADSNSLDDVYVYDQQTGLQTLVSVNSSGVCGNDNSAEASISGDGRFVAFMSYATDLVPNDTNGWPDIFVRDFATNLTTRVNLLANGTQTNHVSMSPTISADGQLLVFQSADGNLVAGDQNGSYDLFLANRANGQIECLSVTPAGVPPSSAVNTQFYASLSASGRFVSFASGKTDIVIGDTNGTCDVFLRDRVIGQTRRINLSPTGAQVSEPNAWANPSTAISGDGRFVAFDSSSSALIANDGNAAWDVFVRDLYESPSTYCVAKVNSAGCMPSIGYLGTPSISSPADDFYVTATNVMNRKAGLLIWGSLPGSTPFSGGTLCISPPITRSAGQNSGGATPPVIDCSGQYSFHFSTAYAQTYFLSVGYFLYAQYWSRDPGFPAPNAVGLTNALKFTLTP